MLLIVFFVFKNSNLINEKGAINIISCLRNNASIKDLRIHDVGFDLHASIDEVQMIGLSIFIHCSMHNEIIYFLFLPKVMELADGGFQSSVQRFE